MGVFGQVQTGRRTQAVPFNVGPWLDGFRAAIPSLKDNELLTLATYRAWLDIPADSSASYYTLPGQTKVEFGERTARERRSILRLENGVKGDQIACGAFSPVGMSKDWAIQADYSAPGPAIHTPEYLTVEDELVNYGLLDKARQVLASAMASGPGRVTVHPGPPSFESLITTEVNPIKDMYSPFQDDYLIPLYADLWKVARIPLAEAEVQVVCDALNARGLPKGQWPSGGALACIALDGRQASPQSLLAVHREESGPAISVLAPPRSDYEEQRLFRTVMTVILEVSRDISESAPASSASLTEFYERHTAIFRDSARIQVVKKPWGENLAAPCVILRPGLPLPVALIVRNASTVELPYFALWGAARWVIAFERFWTHGLRAASRVANRVELRRGPCQLLSNEGKIMSFLRFAHTPATTTNMGITSADSSYGWFWEAHQRSRALEDGRDEFVLFMTGASRAGQVLCYGPEIVSLMNAFAWILQGADQGAEISTVNLWV